MSVLIYLAGPAAADSTTQQTDSEHVLALKEHLHVLYLSDDDHLQMLAGQASAPANHGEGPVLHGQSHYLPLCKAEHS